MAKSIAASASVLSVCLCTALSVRLVAQSAIQPQRGETRPSNPVASPILPKDYVIGVEDVLNVVFWREKDMSAEVRVRPDGKDRKSTRLNSSHIQKSRMPSSA